MSRTTPLPGIHDSCAGSQAASCSRTTRKARPEPRAYCGPRRPRASPRPPRTAPGPAECPRTRCRCRGCRPLAPSCCRLRAASPALPTRRRRSLPSVARSPQSSRRTTGKRSSATATRKPARSQNATVAADVASARAPTSGYASTAAKPRPARSSQTRGDEARPEPAPAVLGRDRDAGDHRGERRLGQLRVEVARPEGPRVRRERAELDVRGRPLPVLGGLVGHEQHLGVAPEDAPGRDRGGRASGRRPGRPSGARPASGRTGCRPPRRPRHRGRTG